MLHCVSTMQKAEPHEALAVRGARSAPSKKIRFTLPPDIVVNGHRGRQRRRACAVDDQGCADVRIIGATSDLLACRRWRDGCRDVRRQHADGAEEAERAMLAVRGGGLVERALAAGQLD